MYKIKILYSNGNESVQKFEDIEDAREAYNTAKEKHEYTDCLITFFNDDKQMWAKQCAIYKNGVEEVMTDQINDLEEIVRLYDIFFAQVGILDKRKSNILHMDFENNFKSGLNELKKIEAYDELKEVTLLRREYKQQRDAIKAAQGDIDKAIQHLKYAMGQYKRVHNNYQKTREHIVETNGEDKHQIITYKLEGDEDAHEKVKELKKKYTRVILDETNNHIKCFNNCVSW